jgi:hypothetical protein
LGEAGGINLYAFVGNNPVNWVDPWGLYVKGTFFRKHNWLILKDMDTGQIVSVHKVYSGNGACTNNPACEHLENRGPLPAGEYLIGNIHRDPGYCNAHPGGNCAWYPLYGPDGQGGYSFRDIPVYDPSTGQSADTRGRFYLHTGRASDGCMTVWSEVDNTDLTYPTSKDFDAIQQLLENATPWLYPGDGTYYPGKLIVK